MKPGAGGFRRDMRLEVEWKAEKTIKAVEGDVGNVADVCRPTNVDVGSGVDRAGDQRPPEGRGHNREHRNNFRIVGGAYERRGGRILIFIRVVVVFGVLVSVGYRRRH